MKKKVVPKSNPLVQGYQKTKLNLLSIIIIKYKNLSLFLLKTKIKKKPNKKLKNVIKFTTALPKNKIKIQFQFLLQDIL